MMSTTTCDDWTLDMTGNWSGLVQKTSGTTGLDQACPGPANAYNRNEGEQNP